MGVRFQSGRMGACGRYWSRSSWRGGQHQCFPIGNRQVGLSSRWGCPTWGKRNRESAKLWKKLEMKSAQIPYKIFHLISTLGYLWIHDSIWWRFLLIDCSIFQSWWIWLNYVCCNFSVYRLFYFIGQLTSFIVNWLLHGFVRLENLKTFSFQLNKKLSK